MRRLQAFETDEMREARLKREAQTRRDDIAADDAAVDRMIRRNIEQHGA